MAEIITLGEIMLRLSTTVGQRIEQSESFSINYGGGEANVAVSLANFGHKVYFASKVPDNLLGRTIFQQLRKHNVLTDFLLVGGERLGAYYVEFGVGERAALVTYDRRHSSFATVQTNEWASKKMFQGKDIFHISGITPALSDEWRSLTLELIREAKQAGCKISFDVNFRGKLWTQNQAKNWLKEFLPHIEYCSAGKMDAVYLLGIPVYDGTEEELIYYYSEIQKRYPNIQCLYSTKRKVVSASENELIGTIWTKEGYFESKKHCLNPIIDRIGGGDAFSAGILHGVLTYLSPQTTIDFATAAAALKHTVVGDINLFTEKEVIDFMTRGSGKIIR